MTVSTDKAKEVFTGTGSQDVFPVTFRIFTEDDIEVFVDGTTQTLNTDYTVENIDNSSFDVDFSVSSSPSSGAEVVVKRDLDIVQETDYTESDSFPAESHEDALDLLTMVNQQQKEELARSLKSPLAEDSIADLPAAADRRGKLLQFTDDANADPEAVSVADANVVAVLDENGFDSNSADNPPSQQSVWESIIPVDNVLAYGAVGDGSTDDTTAIQAAIDASDRPTVFPTGEYLITSQITLPDGARLIGAGGSPNRVKDTGAWILITDTVDPAFSFDIEIAVENIGFDYPNQVDSATPITYPATFSADTTGDSAGGIFRDVACARASVFYQILNESSGQGAGRLWFQNCKLHALDKVIDIEFPSEITEIKDCLFGPGAANQLTGTAGPSTDLRTYTKENCEAIRIGHGSIRVSGGIVWGCLNALHCDLGDLEGGVHDMLVGQTLQPIVFDGAGWPKHFVVDGSTLTPFDAEDTTRVSVGAINFAPNDATDITDSPMLSINGCTIRHGRLLRVVTQGVGPVGGSYTVQGSIVDRQGRSQTSGLYPAIVINDEDADLTVGGCINEAKESSDSGTTKYFILVQEARDIIVSDCKADDVSAFIDVTAGTNITLIGNRATNVSGSAADNVTDATGEIINDPTQWDAKASGNTTRPSFLANANATQTVNAGPDNVVLGQERFDKGGDFASNTFTAPVDGVYAFSGAATDNGGATAGDVFQVQITDGSVTVAERAEMTSAQQTISLHAILSLDQGDTVNLQVQRVTGSGSFNIPSNGQLTYFTGHLL